MEHFVTSPLTSGGRKRCHKRCVVFPKTDADFDVNVFVGVEGSLDNCDFANVAEHRLDQDVVHMKKEHVACAVRSPKEYTTSSVALQGRFPRHENRRAGFYAVAGAIGVTDVVVDAADVFSKRIRMQMFNIVL